MTYTVAELNAKLARMLGVNPYGEGIFQWEWSENLFWPEFPTGNMVPKSLVVPVIGGGTTAAASIMVPEYRREKMAPNLDNQWVMTVWYPPEALQQWTANFPGAAYPARGFRIHTNASLPSFPGGPREPNITDTDRFIALMNFQRSHTHAEVTQGIDDERTARDVSVRKEIEDEIRDAFPAQMNLNPGARGGWVSFPYSKKDLQ